MKTNIQILQNEDCYEALYINDILIEEGNPLQEGAERVLYFIEICDKYGVDIRDIKFYYLFSAEDEFRNRFSEYDGNIISRRF